MQVVIDIPNWLYNAIMECKEPTYSKSLGDAVRDGTPLPKGHGRLKDADELYNTFIEKCEDYNIDNLSFLSDMDMNFDLAQTIIEADRK